MVLKNNIKKGFAGLGIAAILSMSLVTGVSANDDTTKVNDVSVDIQAPAVPLSLETAEVNDFAPITLETTPKTYNTGFADNFTITDLRGTQEGYNLQVNATPFKSAGHTLPTGSLTIDPLTNIEREGKGTGDGPTGSLTGTTAIDGDGAVEVLNAPAGNGAGVFNVAFGDGALGLTVDATTAKVGNYTSTLTWDLLSTPSAE